MVKKFQDLSEEQHDRFNARLETLGIDPSSIPENVTTPSGGLQVGHPGVNSSFPPARVAEIANLQELLAIGGNSDESYRNRTSSDSFVRYPQPASAMTLPSLASCNNDVCQLKDSLSLEQHQEISKALHAAVMGDSSKVEDYHEHINAIHFPMQVALYAAQNITITPDNPLIINNPDNQPTSLVFGTVTVEPGGYIEAKTPLELHSQQFTVQQ